MWYMKYVQIDWIASYKQIIWSVCLSQKLNANLQQQQLTVTATVQTVFRVWASTNGPSRAHTPTHTVGGGGGGGLARVHIRTETSGCDSCASSEGRYVLNHSSLININDSGLWSFRRYDGKQWYASPLRVCTHVLSDLSAPQQRPNDEGSMEMLIQLYCSN